MKDIDRLPNELLLLAEMITDYLNEKSDFLTRAHIAGILHLKHDLVCKKSPIGDHKCYADIRFSEQSGIKPICVDTCLQPEIYELIRKHNVHTIGCCCGHGKEDGYIQVAPEYVQKMHELGYEPYPEKEDGQGKWCFYPKTEL